MTRQLADILYKARITKVIGDTAISIESISLDSREVRARSLFIALRGTLTDGHEYISKAIENGATAIICEEVPESYPTHLTIVCVQNSAEALGYIAANFYDNPSEKIKLIGITGTNGKTTTATILFQLFMDLGFKTGLISTVVNKIGNEEILSTHTTPDAIRLNELLNEMAEAGCEYAVMEVSSHAISQHRVTGVQFTGAVFTNITHDHLDYHGTFKAYIDAKKGLFDQLGSGAFAIINDDDKHGAVMVQNCKARIRTFGLKTLADYKAKIVENQFSGLHININNNDLYSRFIGGFNAYNLLAAYAVACELEFDVLDILTHLSAIHSVEGRFQYFKTPDQITAIVDYAHTPDALKNVLKTIHEIRTGNEKVITVVGCGGDRDKEKRPKMAQIGAEYSNQLILTSDNPRSEDPQTILDDMNAGLDPVQQRKTITISDRKEAIKTACTLSENGDIILIAGKGHEKYQEIAGRKMPFNDFELVNETLKNLAK